MKTKLTLLAALIALAGCHKETTPEDNRGGKAIEIAQRKVPGTQSEPPKGCEILCDGEGHYTVLVDGAFTFANNAVYNNRQAAIDRAWESYRPGKKPNRGTEGYEWKLCKEPTK